MAAPNGARRPGFESYHDRAAPTFDEADAEKICGWSGHRGLDFSEGKFMKKCAAESQRFHDFVEAHLRSGGNIAARLGDHFYSERVVGRARMVHSQIAGDSRGARIKPIAPSLSAMDFSSLPASRKRSCRPAWLS